MLNVDRVWARASQRPEFKNKRLQDFGYQGVVLRYNGLASGAGVQNQNANFPNGAIVLGICGGAMYLAQAAAPAVSSGLSMFALSVEYQQQRQIVGTNAALASSVFGVNNDQFPSKELYIPTNGMIQYAFENLTSSTISIWITHHVLVPVNVG